MMRPAWSRRSLSLAVLTALILPSAAATAALAAPKAPPAKTDKEAAKPALLDLNTATAEQLQELPGIGEAYAKQIVAGRPYKNVKDLASLKLPEATLKKITPLMTVKVAAEKAATKPDKAKADKAAKADKTAGKAPARHDTVQAKSPPKKGMVWVNTNTKIYHKEGSRWYGKTAQGEWMTEADAIKAGNQAAKNEEAPGEKEGK